MKRREQKIVAIIYFMLQHFKLMLQHRAWLEDKKLCRDKEIYVSTKFRSTRNEKLCCNKIFCMLRHKTLMSRKRLDNFIRTMCDIIKLCCDRIQEESMKICHDINYRPRQELGDKDENYVAKK